MRTPTLPRSLPAVLFVAILTWSVCMPGAIAQTGDEIIAKHIEALGGAKAIKALTSIQMKGDLLLGGMMGEITGETEVTIIPGKKIYSEITSDIFSERTGYDGTVAWSEDMTQGLRKLEGDEARTIVGKTFMPNILAMGKVLSGESSIGEKLEDETLGGEDHYVIKTAGGDGPDSKFYVNKKTHLLTQVLIKADNPQMGGEVVITIAFADYEEHAGVKMPTKQTVDVADGMITIESTYTEVTVNGEIDDTIFTMPESGTP